MKLVDLGKDNEDWMERFKVHPEVWERMERLDKLAADIREAVDVFDYDEYMDVLKEMNLSQQEIKEVCGRIEGHARYHRRLANRVIKRLLELKPEHIWSGKR